MEQKPQLAEGIYERGSMAYNPGFRPLPPGNFEPIMPDPVLTVEQADEAVAIVTLNRPDAAATRFRSN